jgi:hypothetical protein
MSYPNKIHLGDGAYVQQGSFQGEVVLTTENGFGVQNRIVLADGEIKKLIEWLVRCAGYDAGKLKELLR